ncbi:NAD-dependent epimerase/dehydratase family protein [Paenibacillus sp. LPE1-1-1.1]|uniref:polysaccharide biosynthesis C-terminal domain-containing protein n=1 Tax=Paenibacillus sp. LPE1-1-1.1 TaxID=3135230 RepID=UPI0034417FBA
MKKILITGANGFIGKNLAATLEIQGYQLYKLHSNHTIQHLREYASKVDFVFHLAGVNRPKNPTDFKTGNTDFTEQLIQILNETGRKTPLLISSSTQAGLASSYGISKKGAEEAVEKYGRESGARVYVYRLPNVFGKWCRPNYNSVIATWCYNISRNLPITINNPDSQLSLVYIDDVVQEFINALHGRQNEGIYGYCEIKKLFTVSLKELAQRLQFFKDSRTTLTMTNLAGDFERYLYSTYVSYLPQDEFGYDLDMKHDNRGWLAEVIKSENAGQIFISRTKPGITRGNHWHHTKVEKFLVIVGEAVIRLRHIHNDHIIDYKVSGENLMVLDIPPGYTHSIENVGKTDVITLFWANEIFDPERADTYFLEV